MKFWATPSGAAILVGIVLAVASLYGAIPQTYAFYLGVVVLAGFAFWLSRWVRYRVFAPGVWLGLFLTIWVPVLHTLFLPTYLAHHPDWGGATTRGAFFGASLVASLVYTFVLAGLAALLAIAPRRRDQARLRDEAAAQATP